MEIAQIITKCVHQTIKIHKISRIFFPTECWRSSQHFILCQQFSYTVSCC